MIPVLTLVGLLAGRWYVAALAALAWPVVLGLDGIISGPAEYAGAAALALVNTAIGVAVHKLIVRSLRGAWSKRPPRLGNGSQTAL